MIDRLWQLGAAHFCATRVPGGNMRTWPCDMEPRTDAGANCYFAVADFKDHAGKRKQANVAAIKAFWLDIDCKNDGYASKDEAAQALVEFCESWAPAPSAVVDSGGGLQVFWILPEAIAPDVWQHTAKRLRKACVEAALRADHSRTTDYSSLMRVPGTFNHGAKVAAALLHEGADVSLAEFTARLPEVAAPRTAPDDDDAFTMQSPPGDAFAIADRCAAMRQMRDTAGDLPEPLWYAGLQVLAHCAGSEQVAVEWSSGHPSFDYEATMLKLERARLVGPTTCERFESLGAPCGGCPLKGRIKSPIQAGREATPITVEMPAVQTTDAPAPAPTLELPKGIRERYTIGKEGVWSKGGGEDDAAMVVFVPFLIDDIGQINDGASVAQVKWRTPLGSWRRGDLPLVALADRRELTKWLYDRAITLFQIEGMLMYLKDYATAIVNQRDPSPVVAKFGWHEDLAQFFLGDRLISATGPKKVRVSHSVPPQLVAQLHPAGQSAKWAAATADLEKYPYHAFALLASFASPVLRLVGTQGAVLSLTGESGVGKTVAAKMAISAWGMSEALQVAPQATQNAKGEMFRIARHLPVLIDDVTQAQFQQMSELVYMAANGRAKERVTRTGQMRGSDDWQLVAVVTTNSPLHEMPAKLLGEAERRRILELTVADAPPRATLAAMIEATRLNHGSVAEPFLTALMAIGVDNVRAMFNQVSTQILESGVPDVQRFGVWLCAAAAVAGAIAEQEGLIQFDSVAVVQRIVEDLRVASGEAPTQEMQVETLLAQYINQNVRSFTVKAKHNWIDTTVYGPIAGTIKVDACVVAIPAHALLQWFVDHRVPTAVLKRWLRTKHINRQLELMAQRGAREFCYQIPLDPEQIASLKEGKTGGAA